MSTVDAQTPLDAAERAVIAGFAGHYASPRAACVDALKHVQTTRGSISMTVLADVAACLDMSATELDEVATAYNLIFRRPVGETVVLLCDSVTCWMMGGDAVARAFREILGIGPGETTLDGRITLLPSVCLGHCDHAPAMMIGEALHGDVSAARLSEILENAASGRR